MFNIGLPLRVLALVALAGASLSSHESALHGPVPRIRFADPVIAALMARGTSESRTFRSLVDRLAASDVFVYVERRRQSGRATGFTQFISSTPQGRYLRIVLDADMAKDGVVALLGHELRHALEVADAPAVVDQDTYGALYRAIGTPSCGPPRWCFDTRAAVSAGRRVFLEVRAAGRTLRDSAAAEE